MSNPKMWTIQHVHSKNGKPEVVLNIFAIFCSSELSAGWRHLNVPPLPQQTECDGMPQQLQRQLTLFQRSMLAANQCCDTTSVRHWRRPAVAGWCYHSVPRATRPLGAAGRYLSHCDDGQPPPPPSVPPPGISTPACSSSPLLIPFSVYIVMRLTVLLTMMSLAASGEDLICYSCKSSKPIDGGVKLTTIDKPCSAFDGHSSFAQKCPEDSLSCVKITDPNDSKNVARGCFAEDKSGCKEGDPNCYCNLDYCNGSGRRWPSAVLLAMAALAAALLGGR